MKKGRVEAFSDGVIAIIVTIMVLEIKAPSTFKFSAALSDLTYLSAYALSYFVICNGWYNHHYLLAITKWFSRRAFWANNIWLFTMSLIPVATAWVSRFPFAKGPEYLYFTVYVLWDVAYYGLSFVLLRDQRRTYPVVQDEIKTIKLFRPWMRALHFVLPITGFILINWVPILGVTFTFIETITWFINVPENGDQLER
ncbi:TMEM175 family protein [Furfurilactobacillus cerevisiae]|uniref:TMEM175 family protein n=1 Tax=Furfurilactobacillus rossiae TaxID=231049 RepID=UPI003B9807F6